MTTVTPPAGTITIAGKTVSRLGFGTMRLTGPGTWGHPDDHDTAITVLRQAVHTHGITHIDTADAYGPHTCETLVRHALYPYPPDVLIATKTGMLRPGPDQWVPHGHPAYLRSCAEASLRRLGVERLDLCYLHRIDREIPADDQFGVMKALQDEGKVGHIGLSKVTPDDIRDAGKHFEIAAVQNVLNVIDHYDPSLETCRELGIPYVAYRPLDAGALTKTRGVAESLAWLLDKGPHVAPIPGTSNPRHLAEIAEAVKGRT
ncbi:aldo/keto reductase [Streptomyces acidiscabies]|uniref:Aldo/keto reductase n=1 Tax=Streptomyces acidiscabies TaxID=42234 RepID=A0AAP6EDV9_9ACTN|nr:aldo/keto reductase [Streptomyces acidiscabies]MBP5941686.1 aldo/keto reductase [Streptomyces sp. LBUM 1476]MBZ3913093.1 aldo/keto reductase [Streptomyces acidiscabies]MDX2958580.1 aldo/keto reductase [Streptomyces acidiscabies]MDX3020914.1 aldo/keto reductase [Streptomyces acidiscabies]MDX3790057.1 aldo/keto reductase [Streptomyces acidiscabies]